MRTTISIEDSLLERAKEVSLSRSCTLSQVIEDALLESLVAKPKDRAHDGFKPIKTFRGNGVRPGVDLDSSASLLEVMGES